MTTPGGPALMSERYEGDDRRDPDRREPERREAPPEDGGPSATWTTKHLVGALLAACGMVAVAWVMSTNTTGIGNKEATAQLRSDLALISQRVGTLEKQLAEVKAVTDETNQKAGVLMGLIEAQNRSRVYTNEQLPRRAP